MGGSAREHLRRGRNVAERIWNLPPATMWGFSALAGIQDEF